jgi:hypothetical protein
MLATTALPDRPYIATRCSACRYFTLERCCNASARLEGQDDRDGECSHFRFGLSSGPEPEWQLR